MDFQHIQPYCAVLCDSYVDFDLVMQNRKRVEQALIEVTAQQNVTRFSCAAIHSGDIAVLNILTRLKSRCPIKVFGISNGKCVEDVGAGHVLDTLLRLDILFNESVDDRQIYDNLFGHTAFTVYIRNKTKSVVRHREYSEAFMDVLREYSKNVMFLDLDETRR